MKIFGRPVVVKPRDPMERTTLGPIIRFGDFSGLANVRVVAKGPPWASVKEAREQIGVALRKFFDPEDALRWLESPHPALGGCIPSELIAEGDGADVWAVIAAMPEGGRA